MSKVDNERDPQPGNNGNDGAGGGAEGGAGRNPGARNSRDARQGADTGGKLAGKRSEKNAAKSVKAAPIPPLSPKAEHRKIKKSSAKNPVKSPVADERSKIVRKHRWTQVPDQKRSLFYSESDSQSSDDSGSQVMTMELPLFPLKNVVLFPGMALPLHIFEARYREMIAHCIEEKSQFGVVLIADGDEVGMITKVHMVGTAARITKVDRLEDGRMNVLAVGTQRFQVLDVDESGAWLNATVRPLPIVNGSTQLAAEMVQKVRPHIFEYVELLSEAMKQKLPLDRLPEDPATLAMLVAIGIQVSAADKQRLLEKSGIPEMLAHEAWMLSRETLLLRHMLDTQQDVQRMNSGPTGYIFPN